MPGITGIITSSKMSEEQNKQRLQLMINSMMHERDYSSGSYINKPMGVYLGWVCHPGSFADCMPIWNERKDKCLLFYGENFPNGEILNTLRRNGLKFNSDTASYLMRLYEEQATDFFGHLNGFFHGVIIDIARNEVVLFNDRYGMQRVYYYENEATFFFSSEAKSLLKICPELRKIDPAGLGQLLSMECILENRTLFKNISLLPGASLWKFKNGHCERKESYFDRKDWENQNPLSKESFYNQLKGTFLNILPRYLNCSRPIGISLTGGLDTRMIMANANLQPETIPCYTFGSMYRDGFDVKVAGKVASVCKQKHFTIRVGKEFLSNFPFLAEKTSYITDGYLDVASGAAELYINRKAREIAPIRITGAYGSEVLRSIRAFRYKSPNINLFDNDFIKHLEHASEIFDNNTRGHQLSFAVFKQAPWFSYNRLSLEQSQLTIHTPFMDNELVSLVYRAPYEAVSSDQISLHLVRDGNSELSKIITNRGVGGISHGFLAKLKQRYFHVLQRAEIGYDYGMPQCLSQVDYFLIPLHLEKIFFGWNNFYHYRLWFRDELSDYLRDILLDSRTMNRPYLNKKFLKKMINGHIKGDHNYATEINKILSTELIHRTLIENI